MVEKYKIEMMLNACKIHKENSKLNCNIINEIELIEARQRSAAFIKR